MPRYSVSVTVRLDADDEDDATSRVLGALLVGAGESGFTNDFFHYEIDDVEDEDEGSNGLLGEA